MPQTILLTGANGGVSKMIRPLLLERYGSLILSARKPMDDLAPGETLRRASLDNFGEVLAACEGVDGIIHMGGQAVEAPWEVIRAANIDGAYNLFEAARQSGVKRIVFASSNHVTGMYPRHRKLVNDAPLRPDSRYGVSKIFGEALGALYADKHGLRVLSIRIGNVADRPTDERRLSMWLHPEDLVQLCTIGLEHANLHHEIVYGISDNMRSFWDNAAARRLGYRPRHRAEDHTAHALEQQALLAPDPIGDILMGGPFSSIEFDGDLKRTVGN